MKRVKKTPSTAAKEADRAADWGQHWMALWRSLGVPIDAGFEDTENARRARQVRDQYLAAMSRTLDVYMRSPLFLELMRYGLGVMNGTAFSQSGRSASQENVK